MAHSASRVRLSVVAGGVMLLAIARGAEAQDARPPAAVETWAGYATVGDSGNHALAGAGLRFYVAPRVSLSPRVRYARTFGDTPDEHTDLYLDTSLTYEFRSPANGRPRMVSPFLLVSGGVQIQRTAEEFVSSGGRVPLSGDPPFQGRLGRDGRRPTVPAVRPRQDVCGARSWIRGIDVTVAAPVTLGMTLRGQDDRATAAQ